MIKHYFIITVFAVYGVTCEVTPNCSQEETANSYLDVATYMIIKARNTITGNKNCDEHVRAMDCTDLLSMGHNKSGVYKVWPASRISDAKPLDAFCDMETDGGGWTVLQRRGNFLRPNDYFYKDWKSYKEGFGDLEKDFWLGNDNIFALSNQKLYSVRFDLRDVAGTQKFALYDKFWIDDEIQKYRLHISDYSGDAGDSMLPDHNNQKFSTKDQKNDNYKEASCAILFKGAWWFNACHRANLNGLYLKGKHESYADGVNWHAWKGFKESLVWTEIKIRPKNFRQINTTTTQM